MIGGYAAVIASQATVGTSFDTYTTAKTVLNPTSLVTLPPNYLYLGKQLRITVDMNIKNVVTAKPTFTFQVMMGSTVAWTTGAMQTSQAVHAYLPAHLQILLRVATVGSSTSAGFVGVGWLSGVMWSIAGAASDGDFGNCIPCPATAVAATTTFDSTISNVLDFWVGISASNAANGVQVYNYLVEDLS